MHTHTFPNYPACIFYSDRNVDIIRHSSTNQPDIVAVNNILALGLFLYNVGKAYIFINWKHRLQVTE